MLDARSAGGRLLVTLTVPFDLAVALANLR